MAEHQSIFSIPLLKLPCIEKVILVSCPYDLISLSYTSKKLYQLIKKQKSAVTSISIQHTTHTGLSLNPFGHFCTPQTDPPDWTAEVNWIKDLFNCSVETVTIDSDQFPIGELLGPHELEIFDFGTKSCENLVIFGEALFINEYFLHFLILNLNPLSHLHLNTPISSALVFPEEINAKNIIVHPTSAKSMKKEQFLQFNSSHLIVHCCSLTASDMVEFVTKWFNSEDCRLKFCYVSFKYRNENHLRFNIDNLNPMPFCEKRRSPKFRYDDEEIDCSNGLDIIRSDRLLATVLVTPQAFYFYVWHEKFTFPLLKLPYLCIEKVILVSCPYNLISLSYTSKKQFQLIKTKKSVVTSIYLEHTTYPSVLLKPLKYYHDLQSGWSDLTVKVNWIKDLFNCSVAKVFIDFDEFPIEEFPELENIDFGTETCEVLHIIGEDSSIENHFLQYILTVLHPIRLVIDTPISQEFQFPEQMSAKYVEIRANAAENITKEQFFQLKSSSLFAYDCWLDGEDMVEFVTRWFNSEGPGDFECCHVTYDYENENHLRLNIAHLNPMPFCEKRRRRAFRYDGVEIDCSNGLDIIRSDGLLATVLVIPDSFFFYVWHERFPEFD